ncbi:Uncharacterized protein Fot_09794 [Forsythia ovata]|uniref:Maturase K n=1 Tax=Forsythia ovata TaxID=205694 RepID=A0ABD1WF12_9LAMI
MRKVCIVELLSNKNIHSFSYIRLDETSRLMKSIQSSSGELINLTTNLFSFTSSFTSRAVIALAARFDLADFFPLMKFLMYVNWNKFNLVKMHRQLDSILDVIIDEHKDNLASVMVIYPLCTSLNLFPHGVKMGWITQAHETAPSFKCLIGPYCLASLLRALCENAPCESPIKGDFHAGHRD